MTAIKLCLMTLAVFALLALCIVKPALAQSPRVVTLPMVRIVAKAKPVSKPCYTRKLIQGSGSVRICG